MTVLSPPPDIRSDGPRLSVVLAVSCGLLVFVGIAALGVVGAFSMRPSNDWLGDPKVVESLVMPAAFTEGESSACATGIGARCYLTSLRVKPALHEVTEALSASTYQTVESRYGTAYTVCGQIDGTPTVGLVRPHMDNAIQVGANGWKIPKRPTYDGRLTVAFIVAIAPACIE